MSLPVIPVDSWPRLRARAGDPCIIPGRPVPWKRTGPGRHTRGPHRVQKKRVQEFAAIWWAGQPRLPADTPLEIEVAAIYARPQRFKGGPGRVPCPAGGQYADADNLGKLVMDALQGLLFPDDRQVVRLTVEKLYGAEGETSHTLFTLRPWSS